LGGHREKILFLVFMVLRLVCSNVGENVKANNWGRGDGGTGDDVGGTVRDIEEGKVFDIVKSSPDRSRGWGVLKLGGLRSRVNRLEDTGGDIKRTWVVPSIVRTLDDFKDGSSGVRNILLIDVIKSRPGGDRDVGEGRGDDDSGLRRVERHSILN